MSNNSEMLTPQEAAEYLNISPRFLYTLTKHGVIPCVRMGLGKTKTPRYPRKLLDEWIRMQCQSAVSSNTSGQADSQ